MEKKLILKDSFRQNIMETIQLSSQDHLQKHEQKLKEDIHGLNFYYNFG